MIYEYLFVYVDIVTNGRCVRKKKVCGPTTGLKYLKCHYGIMPTMNNESI